MPQRIPQAMPFMKQYGSVKAMQFLKQETQDALRFIPILRNNP